MICRRALALAMAAVLLALPLAGCGRLAARRAAIQGTAQRTVPAQSRTGPAPAAGDATGQGMTAADKAALGAEIDAETRDLQGVDVPSDADFNGVDAGLR